jgi:hypothetical protein
MGCILVEDRAFRNPAKGVATVSGSDSQCLLEVLVRFVYSGRA